MPMVVITKERIQSRGIAQSTPSNPVCTWVVWSSALEGFLMEMPDSGPHPEPAGCSWMCAFQVSMYRVFRTPQQFSSACLPLPGAECVVLGAGFPGAVFSFSIEGQPKAPPCTTGILTPRPLLSAVLTFAIVQGDQHLLAIHYLVRPWYSHDKLSVCSLF